MAKKQTESTGESLEMALAAENARVLSARGAELESQESDASMLAAIELMTRDELITLIRTACPQKAQVLLMTEEARGRAIIDMLAITALTSTDRKEARECGKEWMDRTLGRPVQRQAIMAQVSETKADTAKIFGMTQEQRESMMRRWLEKCERGRQKIE